MRPVRRIQCEAMGAMAEMRIGGEKTSFTTAEIAQRLGIEAWRVRRSLKSMAADPFALIWSEGSDRWAIDPRLVKLMAHIKDLKELEEGNR